ncbi:MAG: stage III sporulation protein AC [Christensenellales bacterium]|jgi:stage III sporulation protein AC
MSVDLVFKIAAIGILVAVLSQLLSRAGRDDMAMMTTIAGLIIVLLMVVDLVSGLFETVKRVFSLY